MEKIPKVYLKPKREAPFIGRHPWVFSGSIKNSEGQVQDGDEVILCTHDGNFIARGLYNSQSQIRVRLYSWNKDEVLDENFWRFKLQSAFALRKNILNLDSPNKAYRLVFSEGDGISGLTIDRYSEWLVVQFTSLAVYERKEIIFKILRELIPVQGIIVRTEKGIGEAEGLQLQDGLVWGEAPGDILRIEENGLLFDVDLNVGQKTGFYLDQRENRMAVRKYISKGKKFLDACCYSGAFSLNLAQAGGHGVALDVSERALAMAKKNAQTNDINSLEFIQADVFEGLGSLKERGEKFDLIVLDPPRFARSQTALRQAFEGYGRLNEMAINILSSNGILVTCSCSGHVSREMFVELLGQVSAKTGRSIQILEQRGQSPDHPVSATCPQTQYLKCFICRVE